MSKKYQKPSKVVFETYRDCRGAWDQHQWTVDKPNAFNGGLNYRRFKVTVEIIDEPRKVLIARLRALWAENDNHHNWACMQAEAKELGIELDFKDAGHKKGVGE